MTEIIKSTACHKHNLKPFFTDYIYPISYKIAKKGKPLKKGFALLKIADMKSRPRC